MDNNVDKLLREMHSKISHQSTEMLKIRLRPGMEMLAQELGGEGRQYIPDWRNLPPNNAERQTQFPSPFAPWRPYECEENPIHEETPPSPLPSLDIGYLTFPEGSLGELQCRLHHIGERDPVGRPPPFASPSENVDPTLNPPPLFSPWGKPETFPYPYNIPGIAIQIVQGLEIDWTVLDYVPPPYESFDDIPKLDFLPFDPLIGPEWWNRYFPNRGSEDCQGPLTSPGQADCPTSPFFSPCVPYPFCSPSQSPGFLPCFNPSLDTRFFYEPFDNLEIGNINQQDDWFGPVYPWRVAEGGVDGPDIAGGTQKLLLTGTGNKQNFPAAKVFGPRSDETIWLRVNFLHNTDVALTNMFFWFFLDDGATGPAAEGNHSMGFIYGYGNGSEGRLRLRLRGQDSTVQLQTPNVNALPYGVPHTIVMRLDRDGSPIGNYNRMRLWVNPDLSYGSPEPSSPLIDASFDIGSDFFNRIAFRAGNGGHRRGDTVEIDQISMSTDWVGMQFQGDVCDAEPQCPIIPQPCWYSPFIEPSPSCPGSFIMKSRLKPTARRVGQAWRMDGTGSFPVLFIEACKVRFYENRQEMEQFLADRSDSGKHPILLNLAHVVSIEKITAYDSFAQNMEHENVVIGEDWEPPKIEERPLSLELPSVIPRLNRPEDEMMFQIIPKGGQPPYKFHIRGAPYDLFVTTDGWVRGFIEEGQWPESGYRDFKWQIIVEDSSVPVETSVVNFRYRLYPPTKPPTIEDRLKGFF